MLELPYDGKAKHGDKVVAGFRKFVSMNHITDTREDIPEDAVVMQLPCGDYLFGMVDC